ILKRFDALGRIGRHAHNDDVGANAAAIVIGSVDGPVGVQVLAMGERLFNYRTAAGAWRDLAQILWRDIKGKFFSSRPGAEATLQPLEDVPVSLLDRLIVAVAEGQVPVTEARTCRFRNVEFDG